MVSKNSVVGAKLVNFHFKKDIQNVFAFEEPFDGYEYDSGHTLGTCTRDWQLDLMPAGKRKELTQKLQAEVEKRKWKVFRVQDKVEVYTDF